MEREPFDRAAHALLNEQAAWFAVAELDETIVAYSLGFVHSSFYANGPVAWLEEIMVAEQVRRRGIGTALMSEFERWARVRRAKLVALATRRAHAFYEAMGSQSSASYFRKALA